MTQGCCCWQKATLSLSLHLLVAGLLVELDALGSVLEGSTEWQQDAVVIRARMLRILSLIASRYLSVGTTPQCAFPFYVCCVSF